MLLLSFCLTVAQDSPRQSNPNHLNRRRGLAQQAKRNWEFGQSFSQANLCDRIKKLAGEYVPALVSAAVIREHDAGVVPNSRSDGWDIDVIEQASHETWHNHKDAHLFGLSHECHYVSCFRALYLQRQVFALKSTRLLFTQAQCFPY